MPPKNTGALVKLVRSVSMPVGMSRPVVGHLIIKNITHGIASLFEWGCFLD